MVCAGGGEGDGEDGGGMLVVKERRKRRWVLDACRGDELWLAAGGIVGRRRGERCPKMKEESSVVRTMVEGRSEKGGCIMDGVGN